MKVIYGTKNIKGRFRRPVLGIGIFDGLHSGHRRIIRRITKTAKQIGGTSIILTFEPHPLKVLKGKNFLPLLISLEHRLRLLEQLNIDVCVVVDFNHRFSRLTADRFIKKVVKKITPSQIIVGEDFTFGKDLRGDVGLLEREALNFGFKLVSVPLFRIGKITVTSTYIRWLIQTGALVRAKRFLGRPATIWGKIIKDRQKGRALGLPTANLKINHEVVPPDGVYLVNIILNQKIHPGLCYIGRRPTFFKKKNTSRCIEVHILGFNRQIYRQGIEVRFIKKIRQERRFISVSELVNQLNRDKQQASRYFSSVKPHHK